ncbi:anti-sigma factor antagonist [Streptomyces sp. AK04-3B]|uniref:anti-sigma factor antagonist n=1 Tax=unclassified Streptomyces TaxID=2593676 RepID=UPI0029A70460|nr:anti-sigma factor antagonist [Streptomyces sp. AK04-3B]MDX3802769.1 anti-sigma factor antagonist [Streptomyces sp. AK04-3B]
MAEPVYDADAGGGDPCTGAESRDAHHVGATAGTDISVRTDGERVVVAVRGELDLDSTVPLERALGAALDAAEAGIDLELDGVVFCDCSALNVLLGARERGLRQGRTVVLRSVGPAVERLLTLTGTGSLFAAVPSPEGAARGAVDRDGDRAHDGALDQGAGPGSGGTRSACPPDGELDGSPPGHLRIELVRLRRALRTRPVIDLACGVLMASFDLSADDAWRVLVLAARNTDGTVRGLARDLVGAVEGNPAPGALPEAVTAAVAEVRS